MSSADVFLSYAWADNDAAAGRSHLGIVSEIYDSLQNYLTRCGQAQVPRLKPQLFMDREILKRGANLPQELRHHIESASVFIACLSNQFFDSPWCPVELETFSRRSGILESLKVIRLHLGHVDPKAVENVEVLHNELLRLDLFQDVDGLAMPFHLGEPDHWALFQKHMGQLGKDVFFALMASRRQTEVAARDDRPTLYVPTPKNEPVKLSMAREQKIQELGERFAIIRVQGDPRLARSRYSLHFLNAQQPLDTQESAEKAKKAGLTPLVWCVEAGVAPLLEGLAVFPQSKWDELLDFLDEEPILLEGEGDSNTLAVHYQSQDQESFERIQSWLAGRIEAVPAHQPAARKLVLLSHPQQQDWAKAMVDQFTACGVYLRSAARQNPLIVSHYLNHQRVTTIKEKSPEACPDALWQFLGLTRPA